MEFKELAAAQQAAKQGNAEAQCCLGDFYSSGLGVLQNDLMAAHWYRLAAQQGNPTALYKLGQVYEQGRGVSQDSNQALECYRLPPNEDMPRPPMGSPSDMIQAMA